MTRGAPIFLGLLLLAPGSAPLSASDGPEVRRFVVRDGEVIRLDDNDDNGPEIFRFDGRSHHGYIGVRPIEMTPDLRAHYGAPRDAGVLVGEVEADGPAGKAGLQVGDIVTAVDGEKIESGADLSRAIRRKKDGETARLEILRDKGKKTLTATVAERKQTSTAWNGLPRRSWVFSDPLNPKRPLEHFDLDRRSDRFEKRFEELERRLQDLEKRLPAR